MKMQSSFMLLQTWGFFLSFCRTQKQIFWRRFQLFLSK